MFNNPMIHRNPKLNFHFAKRDHYEERDLR